MFTKRTLLSLAFASLGFINAAHADVIGTYDLNGSLNATTPLSTSAPGFTLSALSAVGVSGAAFANHFYFSGWNSTVNLGKYLQLSVTGASPYVLDTMTFSVESTVTSAATMHVRSSADGYAADVDTFTWASPTTDVTLGDFDFDALGVLSGMTTLRFYITSNVNATFGFANHECNGAGCGLPDVGRDITLNGAVAVPEPTPLALLGLGLVGLAATRRKRAAK